MSLYEGAVKRPVMTALCFVAVVVFGLFSFSKLPIDQLPDIESNTIMVFTYYNGANASDIENNVTRPLENTLNSCSYIKHITSKSSENVSVITLEFEYGHRIEDLTNDVRDKLDMIVKSLPDGAQSPIIFKFDTNMLPIMMLSVQASESQAALYKILDESVVNPLARIPGVGTVSVTGAPQREIYIYCDPAKLEAYSLTIEQISSLIGSENRSVPGGNIDVGNETFALRVDGEFKDPRDMSNLVVASIDGRNVYLTDVARIDDRTQERAQESFNNGESGAMIIIQKQTGANTVEICEKINEMLPQLQKNLPSDVRLGLINDGSDDILQTVSSLAETIIYALIFVIMVVYLFTGRWRATLVVSITIPLSLVASFIYLLVTDGSLNIISLSCLTIAIGMVVDDTIVVLENITTHIERGSDPKMAAIFATNEVALSVMASTLTIFAVFFPLTMITGMTGILFKQLGGMMCVIIAISLVVSLTLTPMLCSKMLKLEKKGSRLHTILYSPIQKALDALDAWYGRRIDHAVRHRKLIVLVCLAVFIASLFTAKGLKSEFFPSDEESRISATIYLPLNTNVDRSRSLAQELSDLWMNRYANDMTMCNFRVGAADDSNTFASMQSNGTHIISFTLSLVELEERSISSDDVVAQIRADLNARPEIERFMVQAGGGMSMGGQSTADFEIYGYDFDATDSLAANLMAYMKTVPGVGEAFVSREKYQPEYQVVFDREKLAQHGLNLSTAANYLRNRIYGATASYFREDGEEYYIKVRYAPEFRTELDDIENILLYGSGNSAVRVRDIGHLEESFTPPTIQRKDRQRINTVSCVIAGGHALSEVVEAGQAYIDKMELPDGVSIQISGDYEEQQESFADMGTLAILIILLVFIVMAAQFESLSLPFIIMFSIPFALSGVLIALWLTGTSLNIMSILGAIMLIGIVVKNGIVLIDYTRMCRERGMSAINAASNGAQRRLRPVLMTTLTTILGMIPMALSQGQGAAMWRPLGISVIGGLTFSTILTLMLVPVLYCSIQGIAIKKERRKFRKQLEIKAFWEENKDSMMHNRVAVKHNTKD
ncbi:MAG: efflux RND transporter permease subunit [Bacteroidaceae bacterium]|nr:efflux RND transporter permease subunit [Bacteroidaceae bacterium]